ncbi:MAG: hypothetical protein GF310_09705 [candidate division Zixibacteria bacterium]|nr:hypothetical protein [candidate division Zixibacteria bacterium]
MMIELMQAHWLTVLIIGFTMLITPMYWFLVPNRKKAIFMVWLTAVVAGFLLTANLYNVTGKLGPLEGALIGALWIVFPLLIWIKREWFRGLSQRSLIGLQIFRVIGGLFILEMAKDNIPASFAMPAGIGDITVGVTAFILVISFKEIPR